MKNKLFLGTSLSKLSKIVSNTIEAYKKGYTEITSESNGSFHKCETTFWATKGSKKTIEQVKSEVTFKHKRALLKEIQAFGMSRKSTYDMYKFKTKF